MLTHPEIIAQKIYTLDRLEKQVARWRMFSKKVVFTNGCFDILHRGHIDTLAKAADCGDVLIVGVNADASVKMLQKGDSRPLQDEQSRALIIASLAFVSAVIIFEEETPYNLIKALQPDVLVKGGDYKVEQIAGHDIVLARGGEVKLIPLVEGFSTTAIEQKIKNS